MKGLPLVVLLPFALAPAFAWDSQYTTYYYSSSYFVNRTPGVYVDGTCLTEAYDPFMQVAVECRLSGSAEDYGTSSQDGFAYVDIDGNLPASGTVYLEGMHWGYIYGDPLSEVYTGDVWSFSSGGGGGGGGDPGGGGGCQVAPPVINGVSNYPSGNGSGAIEIWGENLNLPSEPTVLLDGATNLGFTYQSPYQVNSSYSNIAVGWHSVTVYHDGCTSNAGWFLYSPEIQMNSQSVKDGETATFSISIANGATPTSVTWSFEAPWGSSYDPQVDFFGNGMSTTARGRWFVMPGLNPVCPSSPFPTGGEPEWNAQYLIKARLVFPDGIEIEQTATLDVNAFWSPAGDVTPGENPHPAFSGAPSYAFNAGQGIYYITGEGSLARVANPVKVMHMHTGSRFYNKVNAHENVHLQQTTTYHTMAGLMNVVGGLTDATVQGLATKFVNAREAYLQAEDSRWNNTLAVKEAAAYAVSDAMNPGFLYNNCGRF